MYPLVNVYIAIENGHGNSGFMWIYPLKMMIFHIVIYVSLPGRVICIRIPIEYPMCYHPIIIPMMIYIYIYIYTYVSHGMIPNG